MIQFESVMSIRSKDKILRCLYFEILHCGMRLLHFKYCPFQIREIKDGDDFRWVSCIGDSDGNQVSGITSEKMNLV